MDTMPITLYTNMPEWQSEIADVIRLFVGYTPDGVEETEATFCHHHSFEDEHWVSRCAFLHEGRMFEHELCAMAGGDELEKKRAMRRNAKRCAYFLFKKALGVSLPWGSLTGIRPTRLMYERLEHGQQLEEAAAYIEDFFDVRPEKTALLRTIITAQQGIYRQGPEAVDVYVGIPFCASRCSYCSFGSQVVSAEVEPYLDALERELEGAAGLIAPGSLRALYIGGGTPTSLDEGQFERLLLMCARYFPAAIEWTVEAGRPDTITPGKLESLMRFRATRISINPQTMCDETLARIGRRHSAEDVRRVYALARQMGFSNINMDLIAALPGESRAAFERSLFEVMALEPEHITVHTLAIKRAAPLRIEKEGQPPLDAQVVAGMVDRAAASLQQAGYRPYYLYRQKYMAGNLENVGYAKPGFECVYNVDIMEETTSILAFGAGAISKRIFPGPRLLKRTPNVKPVGQYIERADEMAKRKRDLWFETL